MKFEKKIFLTLNGPFLPLKDEKNFFFTLILSKPNKILINNSLNNTIINDRVKNI